MKELVNKIMLAANKIAKEARKGSGDFMIVSKEVQEAINELDKMEQRKNKLKKIINNIPKRNNEI